jgi:ElaB/YqjD/DUF883 family membrane-anchored ribosome-binding protein
MAHTGAMELKMATATKTADRIKAEARNQWDKLTDDDFDAIKSNATELATRLQARYGISADEARKQAKEFMDKFGDAANDAYARATVALEDAAQQVDRVVKDNAWATVGGALLLGAVIGYLIGSDQRRSYW